jgi:HSP20 family protein
MVTEDSTKTQPPPTEQQRTTGESSLRLGIVPRLGPQGASLPSLASPFTLMRRLMEDLDRLSEDFNGGVATRQAGDDSVSWVPALEMLEQDGQLVIRVEAPGLRKDQIDVAIEDSQLVISGERRREHEDRSGGVHRSERQYGRFARVVALPPDVDPEQAKATFKDGVLEIRFPAPKHPRAHRVEIQDGSEAQPPAQ